MNDPKVSALKKKEKVGADGLTKKERRALKVNEKGSADPVPDNEKKIPAAPESNNNVDRVSVPEVSGEAMAEGKNNVLSKKERRAQKVAGKGGPTEKQVVNVKDNVQKGKTVKVDNVDNTQKADNKQQAAKSDAEEKSKAQLKADRRELQEKQRLAKLETKSKPVVKKPEAKVETIKESSPSKCKKPIVARKQEPSQVQLFKHLTFNSTSSEKNGIVTTVHPSFIRIREQYASFTITGSNARCLALLASLKDAIEDFETPPKQDFWRSFEAHLQVAVNFLQECRPFAVSMTNALRHFKVLGSQVSTEKTEAQKRAELLHIVDSYIEDELDKAGRAISLKVNQKIVDGDVILTFGSSSLVKKILFDAHAAGKVFKVVIVDGPPLWEGREMLRKLVNEGIDCWYTLIYAGSSIVTCATKVLLGAHALLANGYVTARTGTAQVALMAYSHNVPVLVCCETYKFSERVQTDSFVHNELGDRNRLLPVDTKDETSPLLKDDNYNCLTLLNLMYDVTPPDLITAVVTELGFMPCTSVPVILRIKPTE